VAYSNKIVLKINGIDRIRAFAALSVMMAHTITRYLPDIFHYVFTGQPAVFVFFVISGFCIHYPYTSAPLPIPAFYFSRLIRILPVAFIGVVFARISGDPNLATFNLRDGFVLWSVVCELWYYLFYPLFYYLSRFVPWRMQLLLSFLIYAVLISVKPGDQFGNFHYAYGWDSAWMIGLPAWMAGCVLANELPLFQRIIRTCSHRWLWRLIVASVASLLYWLTINTPFKYHYTMNIFALLVVFWVAVEINTARGEFKSGLSDWIGTWSYSIYVFHVICAVFLQMAGVNNWTMLPFILSGCYLAYFLVELPSHKIARHVFRKLNNKVLRISNYPRRELV